MTVTMTLSRFLLFHRSFEAVLSQGERHPSHCKRKHCGPHNLLLDRDVMQLPAQLPLYQRRGFCQHAQPHFLLKLGGLVCHRHRAHSKRPLVERPQPLRLRTCGDPRVRIPGTMGSLLDHVHGDLLSLIDEAAMERRRPCRPQPTCRL